MDYKVLLRGTLRVAKRELLKHGFVQHVAMIYTGDSVYAAAVNWDTDEEEAAAWGCVSHKCKDVNADFVVTVAAGWQKDKTGEKRVGEAVIVHVFGPGVNVLTIAPYRRTATGVEFEEELDGQGVCFLIAPWWKEEAQA